jgi:hypothetical protein
MYKKYNKINDLAYIKRKVKLAKFHLTSQDYTAFFEINDKVRSDYRIQYEVSALDLLQKLNKNTVQIKKYANHFRCVKCGSLKAKKDSYANTGCYCIPCNKKWRNLDYSDKRDYTLKRQHKWIKRNKQKYLNAIKNAQAKRPEYYKTMTSRRYKKNHIFKLCCLVRSRTRTLFKSKNWKKNKRFKDYIGCSPKELAEHIESKFNKRMNWDNHGTYWQLDHKIAIGLNSKTPEDVYRLNHYTNLQPLTIKQHKKKTNKDMKKK